MSQDVDISSIERTFERAKRLGHFKSKYAGLREIRSRDDFLALPHMDKRDLNAAEPELRSLLRSEGRKSYLFASGGTTARPKLSFIPPGMFLEDITKLWKPLGKTDVLCNMFTPGKLWSSHYFYNALGERLASETIALGHVAPSEYAHWIDFMVAREVTALAGTPTTLKDLLRFCRTENRTLPSIGALLWVGEAFDSELLTLKDAVLPDARTWGLYGSTETWVVGYNFLNCPLDTFHVLPYQHLEIEGGRIALTNTHPQCLNPLLRYVLEDAAVWRDCPCGRGAPAVRILGRSDETFKFRGSLVDPGQLIEAAVRLPGVGGAQLVVRRRESGEQDLELRVVPNGAERLDASSVRKTLLASSLDIDNLFDSDPQGFRVLAADRLLTNPRTGKTVSLIREDRDR